MRAWCTIGNCSRSGWRDIQSGNECDQNIRCLPIFGIILRCDPRGKRGSLLIEINGQPCLSWSIENDTWKRDWHQLYNLEINQTLTNYQDSTSRTPLARSCGRLRYARYLSQILQSSHRSKKRCGCHVDTDKLNESMDFRCSRLYAVVSHICCTNVHSLCPP